MSDQNMHRHPVRVLLLLAASAAVASGCALPAAGQAGQRHHRQGTSHASAAQASTGGFSSQERSFISDMRGTFRLSSSVTGTSIVAYGNSVCASRSSGTSQAKVIKLTEGDWTSLDSGQAEQITRLAESDLCSSELPPAAPAQVTFKFWGTGSPDITYGNDSSNMQGSGLPFTAHMSYDPNAMYYSAQAQLNGYGTVHCELIVSDGSTSYVKQGVAGGGYNICDAQLNNETSLGSGWN